MSGTDLDSETDPLENPDIYENASPVDRAAERPLPMAEPHRDRTGKSRPRARTGKHSADRSGRTRLDTGTDAGME